MRGYAIVEQKRYDSEMECHVPSYNVVQMVLEEEILKVTVIACAIDTLAVAKAAKDKFDHMFPNGVPTASKRPNKDYNKDYTEELM